MATRKKSIAASTAGAVRRQREIQLQTDRRDATKAAPKSTRSRRPAAQTATHTHPQNPLPK
jgi:hypothetical protein